MTDTTKAKQAGKGQATGAINVPRRHHFVWRHYLEAWLSGEKIYCLRGEKVFDVKPRNVALKTDFYKLEELSPVEIQFVEGLADKQPKLLRALNMRWIKQFTRVFEVRRQLIEKGSSIEEIDKAVDPLLTKMCENLHALIESDAIEILSALRRGDISFFKEDDARINFLYFVCVQYTRTRNMKEKTMEVPLHQIGVDPGKIFPLLSQIIATSVAYGLNAEDHQLYLLRADGKERFITGDQPVINAKWVPSSSSQAITGLDFYYPISPTIAVLLAKEPPADTALTDKMVRTYNHLIQQNSHEMVFGHSSEALKPFKPA